MPKKSKIVSGKVLSAVAQSKIKPVAVEVPVVETDSIEVDATETVQVEEAEVVPQSEDVKIRFQKRKDELQLQRHAEDEKNKHRTQKRREAEDKKNKREQAKKQKRPADGTSKDLEIQVVENKKVKAEVAVKKELSVEEGNLVFSRLQDTEDVAAVVLNNKKKKATSDPKQALRMIEAEQAKLAKLKETNSDKAAAMEGKLLVKKALQKAQGVAVKDDVNLLKKSIKRREKEKEKSRDTWNKRKVEFDEAKDKKAVKRNENIQERIDAKKNKKRGIKVKKPAFKGKHGSKGGKDSNGGGKGKKFQKK